MLERLGWRVARQRGSHVRLEMVDGRNPVTVPLSRRELDPKTMGSILRQAGLSIREFVNAVEETL